MMDRSALIRQNEKYTIFPAIHCHYIIENTLWNCKTLMLYNQLLFKHSMNGTLFDFP